MAYLRSIFICLALAFSAWTLSGCAPAPLRSGIESEWVPSKSFDSRRPNYVVLHHTGSGGLDNALKTLTRRDGEVSSHYVIARNGRIYQLVDERARAWHAGRSHWGGNTDLNSSSIGIELDNDGHEPFPEPQVAALIALLGDIAERHKIPPANYLGHGDVAPGRKVDPSRHFPWRRLAQQGFGLWCEQPRPATLAGDLNDRLALQALGYDITNSKAAVAAFKRHFAPNDPEPAFTPENRAVLDCLLEQRVGASELFGVEAEPISSQ